MNESDKIEELRKQKMQEYMSTEEEKEERAVENNREEKRKETLYKLATTKEARERVSRVEVAHTGREEQVKQIILQNIIQETRKLQSGGRQVSPEEVAESLEIDDSMMKNEILSELQDNTSFNIRR